MNNEPIFTDNSSVFGDGTEAHPLTLTNSEVGNRQQIVSPDGNSKFAVANGFAEGFSIGGTLIMEADTMELAANVDFSILDSLSNVVIEIKVVAGADALGFFGAAPINKPVITGAKAGNAALASLLTHLASLGLITDSTT